MVRKPIFIGIKDYYVCTNITKKVGDRFFAMANFCGDGTPIEGRICDILPAGDGSADRLVFIKPDANQTDFSHLCAYWGIIPIWLSENGQSGIVAVWKDPDTKEQSDYIEWCEDMNAHQAAHKREMEALASIAL